MKIVKNLSVSPAAVEEVKAALAEVGVTDVSVVADDSPSLAAPAADQADTSVEPSAEPEVQASDLFVEVDSRLAALNAAVENLKKKV